MAKPDMPSEAKIVFWGEKYDVYQWPQKVFDGSTRIFERIAHRDSVKVIPVLPDKTIMMQKEEQPSHKPFVGFPGGSMDPNETPEQAAARELLEETGYEAKRLIPWVNFDLFAPISWEMHVFIGKDLEKVADPHPDAGEKITSFPISFNQFIGLIEEQPFPNLREDSFFREELIRAYYNDQKKEEIRKLLYD